MATLTIKISQLDQILGFKINYNNFEKSTQSEQALLVRKDSDTLEKLILINNEKDLMDLLLEVKEVAFEKGMEEADYREMLRQDELNR
jgi:hypothetical protein